MQHAAASLRRPQIGAFSGPVSQASYGSGLATPRTAFSGSARKRQMAAQPDKRPARFLVFETRAAASEAAAEAVWEATGVPLVDALMKMPTVEAAAQHSVRLVAVALGGVLLGSLILTLVEKLMGNRLKESSKRFSLLAAGLASTFRPCQVLLPFYGVTYSTTVVSALAQVSATKLKADFAQLCRGKNAEVLAALKWFTQLVQDTSELVLIIFAAWVAIDFKNRVFAWIRSVILKDGDKSNDGLVQLLGPVSGIVNFFILLAAAATTLNAYGVNVGPLMASVGGIGVAVGLATQSLAANVVSALSLFTGRAFVVGDRVQLLAGGALVIEGTVISIEPMRTIIRDDDGNPVYVNNAEVTTYIIKNLSQKGRNL